MFVSYILPFNHRAAQIFYELLEDYQVHSRFFPHVELSFNTCMVRRAEV